jgi:hypothetical protein
MREQLSSKSNTCTESADVDVTDISAKVSAQYPGRSVNVPRNIGVTPIGRWTEALTEVSRRHSRHFDRAEGRNVIE